MNRIRWIVLVLCLCANLRGTGFADENPSHSTPRKKFIEIGWDIPSTQYLRDGWREMEQSTLDN